MKVYRRVIAIAVLAFGFLELAVSSHAQSGKALYDNYSVRFVKDTFQLLAGSEMIPSTQFVNSSGTVDADDGTADSIHVGFTFDYNGVLSNTINVNVNGWVSVNPLGTANPIPLAPTNNNSLFTSTLPNSVLAPYWGDHYYRTLESGYQPSQISYLTTYVGVDDTNGIPFNHLGTFIVEWRNLNINDKSNPNSIATFQLLIYQNPKAWDLSEPDQRPTIEFRYGEEGTNASIGDDVVGINDSAGSSFLNGLFPSSQFNGDSTRLSTSGTTCWPPPVCLPGFAIQFVPIPSTSSVASSSTPDHLSAFPNPFTHAVTISFLSPESGLAQITIVNLLGAEVARLFDGELAPGEHSFTWGTHNVAPGIYMAIVRQKGQIDRIPVQLIR